MSASNGYQASLLQMSTDTQTHYDPHKPKPNHFDAGGSTIPNSYNSYLSEVQAQLRVSIPSIIYFFLYKIPWLISLHYLGNLGANNLAAAALATTFSNVMGMSVGAGLSSAISTLTGQSRGDLTKDNRDDGDDDDGRGVYIDIDDGVCLEKEEGKISIDGDASTSYDNEYIESESTASESDHLLLSVSSASSVYGGQRNNQKNQAYGVLKNDLHVQPPLQSLVYLYRGIIIQMAIVLPVGAYWLYGIEPMLLTLGQGRELSKLTEKYLRILTPGLWAYSINFTTASWLQCLDMADVPAYAAGLGCVLHIPFNILFIDTLGFGIYGVAMATVALQVIQPIYVYIYIFKTSHGIQRVLHGTGATSIGISHLGTNSELLRAAISLSGIVQYLSLALPGIVAISEWWASETAILLAGRLHPNPAYTLAGMSIYQSINTFCYMFPCGFASAAVARVGLALGSNDARGAQRASRVGITNAACSSLAMGCVLFFTPRETFPSFFTSDAEVASVTIATLPFLAFYVFADGINATMDRVIKGCGRQVILIPIVIFSYWVVGLPLAYYVAFVRNHGTSVCNYAYGDEEDHSSFGCGVVGLVVGLTTGTYVHCTLLTLTICMTDWEVEVVRAQERMALEKKKK